MAMTLRGADSSQNRRLHQQTTSSSSALNSHHFLPSKQAQQDRVVGVQHQQSTLLQQQQQPTCSQQRTFFSRKHQKQQYNINTTTLPVSNVILPPVNIRQQQTQHRHHQQTFGFNSNNSNDKKASVLDMEHLNQKQNARQIPLQINVTSQCVRNGNNGGEGTSGDRAISGQDVGESPQWYGSSGVLSETNLYIRGLQEDCTDEKLRGMCSSFGKIVSTKAILDKNTKKCRGYGFVDFDTKESANAAIGGLAELDSRIHAQLAKQQEQDPTNLYIANLPPEYDEAKLSELFQVHGLVISSRILRNMDGSSRGVGFCRMTTAESCVSIIADFNGRKLSNGSPPLIVKLADSSSRKLKRVTPSLRSFYSSDSFAFKPKLTATPLMSAATPLMDPLNFSNVSNPSLAAFSPVFNNGSVGSRYQTNYAPIHDLLSAQFQHFGIGNGSGNVITTSDSGITPGQTPQPPTLADFQFQQQQQHPNQQLPQTTAQAHQQGAQLLYQPYYGMPYYLQAAAAAANAYQQPLIVYNPQDYYALTAQQQQQLSVGGTLAGCLLGGATQVQQQQAVSAAGVAHIGSTYNSAPLTGSVGAASFVRPPQQQAPSLAPAQPPSYLQQQQQHHPQQPQQQQQQTLPPQHYFHQQAQPLWMSNSQQQPQQQQPQHSQSLPSATAPVKIPTPAHQQKAQTPAGQ